MGRPRESPQGVERFEILSPGGGRGSKAREEAGGLLGIISAGEHSRASSRLHERVGKMW